MITRPEMDMRPNPASTLSNYDAVMIAEGVQAADEATTLAAWQHLVDTGLAWTLQGFFGRTAQRMIDAGELIRR